MFSDNFIPSVLSIFFYSLSVMICHAAACQYIRHSGALNRAAAKYQKFRICPVNLGAAAFRTSILRVIQCTALSAEIYFLVFHCYPFYLLTLLLSIFINIFATYL